MAGITLTTAQQQLQKYLDAEAQILLGQSVDMDGCRLTHADLAAVQKGVELWNGRVKALTPVAAGGGIVVKEIIPR